MPKAKQRPDLFKKYKTANITRFVTEMIFIFTLCFTYASMVAEFYIALGPLFLITAIITFIVSIIFEIKRLMLYKKIKKTESKVENI